MKIGSYEVGYDTPPFCIAEMSGNHNGSLERALEIVRAAKEAGAHALKLQTYKADTITMDCDNDDFIINDPESLWAGRKLYELYEEAHTPWEWHKEIFELARSLGMEAFSSPFDETAVDFLEDLNVPAYKIASFECTHLPLIRKVAATKKPMIISTGLASKDEVQEAVETAKDAGAKDIVVLKCTSDYPADASDANLATIKDMRESLGVMIGLSDHTAGIGVAVASVVHGAVIIEKHFTTARSDGGVDSDFSLEENEFKLLVEESRKAWQSFGKVHYGGTEAEQGSKAFRQSVQFADDLSKGDIFTKENLIIRRPGFGLPPKDYDDLLGKKASRDIKKGERSKQELFE